MTPVLALIGRPNVGKSTLFNVLTKSRDAIVANQSGLTRDRQYGVARWLGCQFIVVDTGGLSGKNRSLDKLTSKQTQFALDEADEILLIVDARDGLTHDDQSIADLVRKSGKPCSVVINKADGGGADSLYADFYALGFSRTYIISATHQKGIRPMLEAILTAYPKNQTHEATDRDPKIAIIGRPNVGKSTLVNRLVGEERLITFDQPGTTRDTVSVTLERRGRRYILFDTAGVRKRGKVHEVVEKFSIIKTLEAIENAHVVILLIDARDGLTDQDMTLLGYVLNSGRALVLAVNKCDGLEPGQRESNRRTMKRRLTFAEFAAQHNISALHGTGVGNMMTSVDQAYDSAFRDMNTRLLTDLLEEAIFKHNPPLHHRRRIKLRYAHQGGRNPPVIVIHGNKTEHLPALYKRYLMHFFTTRLKLKGTPVRIELKSGSNPYVPDKRFNVAAKKWQTFAKKK